MFLACWDFRFIPIFFLTGTYGGPRKWRPPWLTQQVTDWVDPKVSWQKHITLCSRISLKWFRKIFLALKRKQRILTSEIKTFPVLLNFKNFQRFCNRLSEFYQDRSGKKIRQSKPGRCWWCIHFDSVLQLRISTISLTVEMKWHESRFLRYQKKSSFINGFCTVTSERMIDQHALGSRPSGAGSCIAMTYFGKDRTNTCTVVPRLIRTGS